MKKYLETICASPLFAGIPTESMDGLLRDMSAFYRDFSRSETIMQEGEAAYNIGLLLTGKIHIIKEDYYGNRMIIAEILPGDLFAEVFVCAGVKAVPVSVMAAEDSKVLLIDYHACISFGSQPIGSGFMARQSATAGLAQIQANLLQIVAQKTLMLSQKIDILSKRTTRQKLLAFFSSQAQKHGTSQFEIPFNRQQLADFLCVERSAMCAELSRMKQDGLINYHKKTFVINEPS